MSEISIENREELLQILNNLQDDTIIRIDFEGEIENEYNS